mmetsp:Transcript_68587/g.143060  ORF Transcript_68587/g.143060 Transcript_68587/m.143060 type:complete len:140 (-) Transcript_68587:56-475(-)|eukprot:CAMPEP_0181293420 /NCGR_PEP_ID=MMETSP1101-20121128/3057_1 /TAXON_ID=46948 /ORGANISM="Rhodomonas abbreviata, Strain Caron Lab Isolate" /LENGTH=139 /DNA_ID=CAMNT_0023398009 /DNA_START=86 /DNA_END=505 /DNA_ORIENTATION=-
MMNILSTCCGPIEPPNKVSRIEPKTFLANERTFLNWLAMSVTLGSIASALVAFGKSEPNGSSVQIMASVLVITAIFFCIYAMNTFFWRRRRIRRKEDGNFDDPYGPLALSSVLLLSLGTIFASGVVKLASNGYVQATYF